MRRKYDSKNKFTATHSVLKDVKMEEVQNGGCSYTSLLLAWLKVLKMAL